MVPQMVPHCVKKKGRFTQPFDFMVPERGIEPPTY